MEIVQPDVDSRHGIAEVPTDKEIRNAIENPRAIGQVDVDDVEEENIERPYPPPP